MVSSQLQRVIGTSYI
uniref:Uncharacterized protein n=1 Tax=Anguilla anguilla TaxID=7936 RepID=A0A0E9ULU6_ANGAN